MCLEFQTRTGRRGSRSIGDLMTTLTENLLMEILTEGTRLVRDAAAALLPIREFIERYNNFYYYNALDGHEEDEEGKELLARFANAVSLHQEVQEDIVDKIYLGEPSRIDEFKAAGRIDPQEALERLGEATKRHKLDELILSLQQTSRAG